MFYFVFILHNFALYVQYFHFRSMRISFIRKVTRVDKATIVANDTILCVAILVLFLEFYPSRPAWNFSYEQTTKFVAVTELARLPGSYEEALKSCLLWFCVFRALLLVQNTRATWYNQWERARSFLSQSGSKPKPIVNFPALSAGCKV